MLTDLATRMDTAVSVLPENTRVAGLGLGNVGLPVAPTCADAGFDGQRRFGTPHIGNVHQGWTDVDDPRQPHGFKQLVSFNKGHGRTAARFVVCRAAVPA
jgi:hypothetical protein